MAWFEQSLLVFHFRLNSSYLGIHKKKRQISKQNKTKQKRKKKRKDEEKKEKDLKSAPSAPRDFTLPLLH